MQCERLASAVTRCLRRAINSLPAETREPGSRPGSNFTPGHESGVDVPALGLRPTRSGTCVEPGLLLRIEHPRARQEPHAQWRLEREPAAAPGYDVDEELRVLPGLELLGTDVERRPADLAEE